jgi:hypothetical protein
MARIRGTALLGVMASVVVMVSVLVSCAPESESDVEVGEEGQAVDTPRAQATESSRVADPAERERIDLMTQDATRSVVRAASFLGEQARFSVTAEISYDVMQSDGRLLEFGARREIIVGRPNRVRMNVARRDGEKRELYFDGATISIDLGDHQAYVQESRPGSLYEALGHLSDDLGIPVPLANLLSEDFASPLEGEIAAGYYVGPADIGGRRCEHLAFRLPDRDVQLWIEEGDRPLVARIVITHSLDPGKPQFRATLEDWDLGLDTPEELFRFDPPEGSERLAVESITGSAASAEGASE